MFSQPGDLSLLQKMVEGKGFTRTCPEAMAKLLEKGDGFGTKHIGGLNANGDKVVCGRQVRILGFPLLLCHQSGLWKPRQCVKEPECRGM